MNTTVINHSTRTITTYELTNEIVEDLKDMFSTMFSKEQPVYSLGFQRLEKLSKKRKLSAFKALYFEGFKNAAENQTELKKRLEAMTEIEFKAFKLAK